VLSHLDKTRFGGRYVYWGIRETRVMARCMKAWRFRAGVRPLRRYVLCFTDYARPAYAPGSVDAGYRPVFVVDTRQHRLARRRARSATSPEIMEASAPTSVLRSLPDALPSGYTLSFRDF